MEFKYKSKISEVKKYDTIAKVYLSYYVDPVNNEINKLEINEHELLSFNDHPTSIIKKNWDYNLEGFNEIKKYSPKFVTNFTNKAYQKQKLINEVKFKINYQFMSLNLSDLQKYEKYSVKKAEFIKVDSKEQLDSFVKIVGTIFSDEVTDSKKFYGIFEEYQKVSELYIIKYDGQYVGTGHLTHFDEKITVIDDIAMLEVARGKGLATFLMKSLINRCLEKGQKEACLFGSKMAFNIYKKLGFKEENFWLEQFKVVY